MRLCLVLALSLSCSTQGRYYLRNLTDYPATVRVVIQDDYDGVDWNEVVHPYEDSLLEVEPETYKTFKKGLSTRPLGLAQFEFIIPAHSTVFIGYGLHKEFLSGFDQAIIQVKDKEISLDMRVGEQINLRKINRKEYLMCYDITY